MGADSTDTPPPPADSPLSGTDTSLRQPDVGPVRDEGTPATDAAVPKPGHPAGSDSPGSAEMPDAHPTEAPWAPTRDEAHAMAVVDLRPVVDEGTAPAGSLGMASPPDAPSNADEGAAPLSAVSKTPPGLGDDTANTLAPDALSPDTAPDTDHSTATQDASGAEPNGPLTPMDKWEASEDRQLAGDIIAHRQQQDILRQQGNEQGAQQIEDFINKLPTTDTIKADPQGYLDGLGNDEVPPSPRDAQHGAGDGAASAETDGPLTPMDKWEASEDRILQDNADYFDAEAQRYRELGDHDAATASQEAGDRARSLIGDSAHPNSADAPPSSPENHVDSVGTGNENRIGGQGEPSGEKDQLMDTDSTDMPLSADNPLRGTGTSRAGPDVSPQRDEGTPASDAAAPKPEDPVTSDSPVSGEMPDAHSIGTPSALDRDEANVMAVADLQKDLELASAKGGTDRAPADWETSTELPPNATIDAGNYQFGTDHLGRVIQATGDLKEGKAPRQRQDADHVREMIPSDFDDQAGHLIPAILGGPGDNWNMLPQDRNLNQSEWRIMENEWRNALKEGSSVKVDISLSYHGDDLRPYAFNVEYTTKDRDGKSETVQRDILNAPRAAKDELNTS